MDEKARYEILREIANYLGESNYKPGACYRCWQVGKYTKAVAIVLYNKGTEKEWKSASCDKCALRDVGMYPYNCKIIARLV